MVSLGAVVLATPNDPLEECLESFSSALDEVVVFTWDNEQAKIATTHDAKVVYIEPVSYVELVRQEMQSSLSTDWVLILDPDEVVEFNAIQTFRERIQAASPVVVGFWVPYRMLFMGDELRYSFPAVKQMRLFRRNKVRYTREIHNVPLPLEGFYDYMADTEPGLAHQFVINLRHRFERHLLWAQAEAEELNQTGSYITDPIAILEAGLEEFKLYTVQRHGLRDGCKGLVNALMHSWKKMATLCFLWEIQQAENFPIQPVSSWENLLSNIELNRPQG